MAKVKNSSKTKSNGNSKGKVKKSYTLSDVELATVEIRLYDKDGNALDKQIFEGLDVFFTRSNKRVYFTINANGFQGNIFFKK